MQFQIKTTCNVGLMETLLAFGVQMYLPDEPFHNFWASTFLEQRIYVLLERRATDFKATEFWKGSSGSWNYLKTQGFQMYKNRYYNE